MSKPTLYLIDASGFIFRAYHSLPPLTRPDGTPVGAVYGFVNMLTRLMEGRKAEYIGVIFDAARKTFRNNIYAEYKAHRPPAPDDLIPQFAIVREATEAMNMPAVEMADYEADDLIALYAKQALARGMEVVIVSSDKDLMQLVGEGVTMYDAMKQKTIGVAEVLEKFGVSPDKVIEVQALIGDASDNVPGVPGIGPKTAAELINHYGDLENLLLHAHEIKQNKRRESIIENADKARLSRELVKLTTEFTPPVGLDAFAIREPDAGKLIEFLRAQGFKSLVARLENKHGISAPVAAVAQVVPASAPSIAGQYQLVNNATDLAAWVEKARAAGKVAFDIETNSLDAMQAKLVGFSLCVEAGSACYVPLGHVEAGEKLQQTSLFGGESESAGKRLEGQMDEREALQIIKPLLEDAGVIKIGQNIKYDMLVMKRYGVEIAPIADTMLMSYVLHAGSHAQNMDELAQRYLNHKTISFDEVTGTGKQRLNFSQVALDKALAYAAEDADVTLKLHDIFKPELTQEKLVSVYESLERPLVPVLVEMEARGILVDKVKLREMSSLFAVKMAQFEQEAYQLAGHEFNLGSPKQLGEVLFDEMGIEGGKKSAKTGAYATGADILEELAEAGHALPAKVLEWRQLSKLKSTYTDALPEQINPTTGRVHTSYAMAVASTGRLSSTDPNLQNIPIRSEEGKKIRHAFIAKAGTQLLSADYSQIELRLLAHIADIETLKSAFRNGDDIHAITASQMFGVPVAEVSSDLRRSAKTINFGIIYGISAHGLAMRLGIGRGEAASYIDSYFKQYPGIREYMETTKEFARTHGYVTTLYGRRCHVPGINEKGPRRSFSERAAINAPLQGTAADIIKRAMITIHHELKDDHYQTAMLLQVHDELVFEVPDAESNITPVKIKELMESAARLSVPLTVETGLGANWGEIH